MSNFIIFKCPHCKNILEKNIHYSNLDTNKQILFRHGLYKSNLQNIDYNLSNLECFNLFIDNRIYGCGKKCTIKYDKIKNKFTIF